MVTLEEGRAILQNVIDKADQWGKFYTLTSDSEYSGEQILDALTVVMAFAQFSDVKFEDEIARLEEEKLKFVKDLRAAKAREGKLKKKIKELDKQVTGLGWEVNPERMGR